MMTSNSHATNAAVRRLAISQGLSYAGRGAALTALIWALYSATGSAWWLSGAMLAIFGAATAVSPWTGHAGDRHDRRVVIIISAALAAVGFGACALLVWHGDMLATILVTVAAGCTQGALTAAVQGAVPNLVADEELARANSLAGAFRSAGYMLGPGIGGALLAVTTAPGVFVVSAAMMAVSALLMVGIHTPFHADRQEEIGGRMDGYRQLMADRWMRRLTLAWALIMIGVGPVIVAEVVLAHHFRVGSLGYGLISVFWDGGGVAGAILGVRLVRRFEQAAVVGGSAAIAAGFAIVGLTPIFWPVLLGMMVAGVFDSFGTVAAQNMLQRRTPGSPALARVGRARRGRARRHGRVVRAGRTARHLARRPGRVPGRVRADRGRHADARARAAAYARAGDDLAPALATRGHEPAAAGAAPRAHAPAGAAHAAATPAHAPNTRTWLARVP